MILIDPELKSGAPPKSVSAKAAAAKPPALPSTRTLARFLSRAQDAVGLRGQVTVLLTSDAAMRDLNRRFRGKDRPTDVLSFPSEHLVRGTEKIAGDLAIGVETAQRQSVEQGHALGTEIRVLMLHGLLHLAGYDHEIDAGAMERREQRLRARLGLPLGLIERAARSRGRTTADASTRPGKPGLAQADRSAGARTVNVKRTSGRRRKS